jgi:hypothetical protein
LDTRQQQLLLQLKGRAAVSCMRTLLTGTELYMVQDGSEVAMSQRYVEKGHLQPDTGRSEVVAYTDEGVCVSKLLAVI